MSWHKDKTAKNKTLNIPESIPKESRDIAIEVLRLHESALNSSQRQFEQMKLWRWVNYILGVPAAALAAISGGTGLAAHRVTTTPAILALVAAGFGAALTTLNPSRRVTNAQTSANSYLKLQMDARQLLLVKLSSLERGDALIELENLSQRIDEINRSADPPSVYANWRAKSNINNGGQIYEIDEGE